ncbi:hypothetical protein TNCV_2349251 [Trichonephila clavipes]|uniref:Vomeronasal type-1 receptor n=1 Tax=Trichonephila clavipes TaxID=2585209 RepID=A0A8X6VQI9_TRICX|nr:hypothetical protein TNCV_2349251 [Trichonephila clavipes]
MQTVLIGGMPKILCSVPSMVLVPVVRHPWSRLLDSSRNRQYDLLCRLLHLGHFCGCIAILPFLSQFFDFLIILIVTKQQCKKNCVALKDSTSSLKGCTAIEKGSVNMESIVLISLTYSVLVSNLPYTALRSVSSVIIYIFAFQSNKLKSSTFLIVATLSVSDGLLL